MHGYRGFNIGILFNIGKKKGHFLFGLHQLHNYQQYTSIYLVGKPPYVKTSEEYIAINYSVSLGYRHLPLKRGITYDIQAVLLTPSFLVYDKMKSGNELINNGLYPGYKWSFPWIGFGIGYIF